MSYDIHLFKKLEGQTASESAETVLENTEINALSDEEFKEQRTKVKHAIKEKYDDFEAYEDEESLTLDMEKYGIQISLYQNQISVTVPYWHKGEEGEKVADILSECTAIVSSVTGYAAYDPQMDEEIDIKDKKELRAMYGSVAENLETITESALSKDKKKSGLLPDTKVWIVGVIIVALGYFLQVKILFVVGILVAFFGGNILPFFIKQK